jgi:hypothetical protein
VSPVVVTGDILRVGPTRRADQWVNIGWMKRLLEPALSLAVAGAAIEELVWVSDVSEFDGAMVYAAHGLKPSQEAWACLFHAEPNGLALAYLAEFFDGALVIGFELSPYLRRALEALGVVYVDLCIHPVRYLEDLLLYAASNDVRITERLQAFEVTDADLRLRSTFLAGVWRGQGYAPPRRHSAALLCLQTPRDRVLVDRGGFVGLEAYLPELQQLRSSVDRLYIKPHPLERNEPALGVLTDHLRGVEVVSRNFYEMMARDQVDEVWSLSSGTSIEARGLGKAGRHLFRDYYEWPGNRAGGGAPVAVMEDVLWPDFWRQVLEPVAPVTAPGGYRRGAATGTLRRTLGESWDFAKWLSP